MLTFDFLVCSAFCLDIQEETDRVEQELDPKLGLMRDSTAMSLLRLDYRIKQVLAYLNRLKSAFTLIDEKLFPGEGASSHLEPLMSRMMVFPDRIEAWKKSAARCGADVALSLVRVHCKNVEEEKLKALRVANTRKLQFQDFLETFIEAATKIADAIDLSVFIDPADSE